MSFPFFSTRTHPPPLHLRRHQARVALPHLEVRDALGLTPRLRACRCRRGGRGPCTCNPKKTKTYASFNVREAGARSPRGSPLAPPLPPAQCPPARASRTPQRGTPLIGDQPAPSPSRSARRDEGVEGGEEEGEGGGVVRRRTARVGPVSPHPNSNTNPNPSPTLAQPYPQP